MSCAVKEMGPKEIILIDSEEKLLEVFGIPDACRNCSHPCVYPCYDSCTKSILWAKREKQQEVLVQFETMQKSFVRERLQLVLNKIQRERSFHFPSTEELGEMAESGLLHSLGKRTMI